VNGWARLSLAICAALLAACDGAPTDVGTRPVAEAGRPLPFLTPSEQALFDRGEYLFKRIYTPAMGLGPLFNGRSCAECHHDPVPGGSGVETGARATVLHGGVCSDLSDVGGPVIQLHVTPALHDALGIDQEPLPAQATAIGYRTSPALWGSGLLDAVPDADILARADPDDRDGDGISGRPNMGADGRPGRFGRKAQVTTLWDFVGDAYVMEMGITNTIFPVEQTVAGQPLPPGVDQAPDSEIAHEDLNAADAFMRWMAAPSFGGPAQLLTDGGAIFSRIGCATCHVPKLYAGENHIAAVSHHVVPAYTDLLLHDMGSGLADICTGQALPGEFRTEPLWGLRFRLVFLHDGHAPTIDAAIQLHGGEGKDARDRYLALSDEERATLLQFLGSL
jgi:CxxC motif-containing protein (DUF1111 family)